MQKMILFAFILFLTVSANVIQAQGISGDETVTMIQSTSNEGVKIMSDTLNGWDYSWVGGLNGSQAAYSNWSQGGVNTVSVTASTVFGLKYRKDRFGYVLNTDLKYGQARIEGEGMRKTDDRISMSNKFNILFDDKRWRAFGNLSFRTQFDAGYNYGTDPATLISGFMAPGYLTQVFGIGFTPNDYMLMEGGLAMKETIVSNTDLSTRYGLDEGEKFRFEPGYSFIINYEKEIFANVKLTSSLETFTNLQRRLDRTDINFSNELIGKINNFMNTSLQFQMLYDDDFSRDLQIKQVLSVGVSFNILS